MAGSWIPRVSVAWLLAGCVAAAMAQGGIPPEARIPAQDAAAQTEPEAAEILSAAEACLPPLDAMSEAGAEAEAKASAARAPGGYASYIHDPLPAWRKSVPMLRGLKLDKTVPAENPCVSILRKTGETVMKTLEKVPNLAAKEQLTQVQVRLPYTRSQMMQNGSAPASGGGRRGGAAMPSLTEYGEAIEGEELKRALHDALVVNTDRTVFSYRIRAVPNKEFGVMLDEYRTDKLNNRVTTAPTGANPRDAGFGNSWLLLAPTKLEEARFRYLGTQRLGKHETFVLAFAQLPQKVRTPGVITLDGKNWSFCVQGVVWIDRENYQIVRLQTDLMGEVQGTTMKRLRTEIELSEVKIPQLGLRVWMPATVEVNWEMQDGAGAELHSFSNYRLYQATSRIVVPTKEQ